MKFKSQLLGYFTRKFLPIVLLMGVFITFSLPVTYFLIKVKGYREQGRFYARQIAERVRTNAEGNPVFWQYANEEFLKITREHEEARSLTTMEIFDSRGHLILQTISAAAQDQGTTFWTIPASAPVKFENRPAGQVRLTIAIRPLVINTAKLTLIFFTVGILVTILSYFLPAMVLTRMEKDILRQTQQISLLLETSNVFSSSLDLNYILQSLAKRLFDTLEVSRVGVLLIEENGSLTLRAHYSEKSEGLGVPYSIDLDRYPEVRQVLDSKESLCIQDVQADSLMDEVKDLIKPSGVTSLLILPVKRREQVLGCVTLAQFKHGKGFSREDIELCQSIANQAAISLENARLYERSRAMYEELQTTQERLIQSVKLRALGEMSAGVAHDFNNMLAGILSNVYLLKQGVEDEERLRRIKIVERAALDGAETVRRIQQFTRRQAYESFTPLDLCEIVRQSIELTEAKWKDKPQKKGITIHLETVLTPLPLILGISSELREVLMNLIFNAVDAMPQGGTLSFRTWKEAEEGWLSVSDSGVGMTEEVKKRVFDPFFTTKGEKGTGLGLSVAYGIMLRHQGEIFVDSKPGQGSTFSLRFPVHQLLSLPTKTEETPAGKLATASLLLVDDDEIIRDSLSLVLTKNGYRVTTAAGGREALSCLAVEDFSLIITDLGMPEISGLELARVIKSQRPQQKIMLLTGWGEQLEPEEVKRMGVDFILPKPYQVETVLKTISNLLS